MNKRTLQFMDAISEGTGNQEDRTKVGKIPAEPHN